MHSININKDHCLLGDSSLIAWHRQLVQSGVLFADERQVEAVKRLQVIADVAIKEPSPDAGSVWAQLFASSRPAQYAKRGLYLHGGVGRGKSFLMDGFYLQLQIERKMRAHFHQFMRHFHEDMKKRETEKDPLLAVADGLSEQFSLVCFDEFHVSDITDAMILGRLLKRLLDNGTHLVATSNYAPAQLYPNGLARDRFLPAIAMLEERLEMFALDGAEDYRLRHINNEGKVFFHPHNGGSAALHNIFDKLACGIVLSPQIKTKGRQIPAKARSSDVIWFSFSQLCAGALGQGDYLNLAGRFATVILSEVPALNAAELSEAARRFTWLVDILYDQRVTLIMSAATPLEQLYGGGGGGESGRTLSRLIEMQSPDYWDASFNRRVADTQTVT